MRCVFCKRETIGSVEHIIPEALVGFAWLTVREVCKECNNSLGSGVDNLSSRSGLIYRLAVEAGLAPWGKHTVEVEDPRTGEWFPGQHDYRDGTINEIPVAGKGADLRLRVFGETQEETHEKAESIARKRRSRGRPTRIVGPFYLPRRAKARRTGGEPDILALLKFAAKATVEYVCCTAGSDVALMPDLDPMREFLFRDGSPISANLYFGGSPRWLWLPKQSVLLVLDEEARASEETQRMIDWMSNNPRLAPSGVPLPPKPYHELRIERRGGSAVFALTLFGMVVTEIALPPTVSAGSVLDSCELLTHRQRRRY